MAKEIDVKAVKDTIKLLKTELKDIKAEFKVAATVVKEISGRLGKKEKEIAKLEAKLV